MAHVSNEDRRKQFVAAAIKVIRTHGVANATTRKIAEVAGAPLGSLHYAFKNKEELFEEVAKSFGVSGKSTFLNSVEEGIGVAEAAKTILKVFAGWSPASIKGGLTELEFYMNALRSKPHRKIPKIAYNGWLLFYRDLLKKAQTSEDLQIDIDAVVRLIVAFQDGLILQDQFLGNGSFSQLTDAWTAMLVNAIERGELNLPGHAPSAS